MKYEVSTNGTLIGTLSMSDPTLARSIAFLNVHGYVVENGTPTIDLDGSWYFDNSFHFKPIK